MDWSHRVAELLSLPISYVFTGLRPVSPTKVPTPGDGRPPGSPHCLCSEVSIRCPAGIQQILDGGMSERRGTGENDCRAGQEGRDGERSIWTVEEELPDLQAHRTGCVNSGSRGGLGCPWASGTGQDRTTWQGPGLRWERSHLKEEQFCITGHTAQLGAEGGDGSDRGV